MAHAESAREMSAFDAFLYRGDDHPRTRAVLAAAYVLDQSPSHERLADAFERASRLIPRLRQRVVAPPWPAFLPSWVVDPDFDLNSHLRFARLPRRASLLHLLESMQSEIVQPLAAGRPLWDAVLYEGLAGKRAGLLFRMSHAVTDGIGAIGLFGALFDTLREPAHGPLPPLPIPRDITPDELLREALARAPWSLASTAASAAGEAARGAARLIAEPGRTVAQAQDYVRSLGRVFAAQATPSPALAGRSLERQLIAFEVPLEALRRAGRAAAGSVNDAYLAGLVGALRLYHQRVGMPVSTLPIAVPVNLRDADELDAGNHFGAVLLAAPVGTAEPKARIARIRAQMLAGRAEPAIDAPALLAPVLARLPDSWRTTLAERAPRPDIQASNVPGSPRALFIAGSHIERAYAFGPVPGAAAMLTMQSLAGTCFIGVNLDPAAFLRPRLFADCLAAGFDEVLALAGTGTRVAKPVLGRSPSRPGR